MEGFHKTNIQLLLLIEQSTLIVLTYIGVDDVAGARAAGQYIAERLNGEGNVLCWKASWEVQLRDKHGI